MLENFIAAKGIILNNSYQWQLPRCVIVRRDFRVSSLSIRSLENPNDARSGKATDHQLPSVTTNTCISTKLIELGLVPEFSASSIAVQTSSIANDRC
jgi:hypothetical protein